MSITTVTSINGTDTVSFDNKPNAKQRYKLNSVPVVGVTTFIKAGMPTPEALQNWKIGKGAEYALSKTLESAYYDVDAFTQGVGCLIIVAEDTGKQIIKDARTAWKKDAEEAAGIGIIVHDYAHLSSLGKHEEALEMLSTHEGTKDWDQIQNAIYKVDAFNEQNKDEIIALETIVGSTKYSFAGRFDRLVRRNGMVILSDYKTSKGFYVEQFIQDAAYSLAIEEWLGVKVDGYEVIRFGKDGGEFEPLLISDEGELLSFRLGALRCLETYQFLKTWNKDKRFAYGGK